MTCLLTNTESILSLTPEAADCALGEAFLLQSSELVEDVDVGVIGTALLLLPETAVAGIKNKYFPVWKKKLTANHLNILYLPEHAFDLFMFFGFRFLV